MKKVFTLSLLFLGFTAFFAQSIAFDQTTINFGSIAEGSVAQRNFTVQNTGKKPLILNKVQAACGCTTPKWSSDPIMPGKSAHITVGYDTRILGEFSKLIEVYSNDPDHGRVTLYIKGTVEPKATTAARGVKKAPVRKS